ncbi:MAG: hypothetical protein IAF38_21035, partial [Bacteroidia bacterium]|nr:hypothetical protein [Bacteroidia bacterium]
MRKVIFFTFFLFSLASLNAAIRTSLASGNWTTPGIWSGGAFPVAGDVVTVSAGHTITMNVNSGNCLSLTVNGTLNWTAALTTNVSGGLTLNNGSSITGSTTGTLNAATFSVTAGGTANLGNVNLNVSGNTTVSGTLVFNNTGGTKTFTNITVSSGGVWRATAGETETVTGNFTMLGGTINGTSSHRLNITGNFDITSGANSISRVRLVVTGTTNVTGTLTTANTTGTKTLNNLVINAGGDFDCIVNETWAISGNFTNNGTFTSGTGTYTFSGAIRTFSGNSNAIFNGDIRCTGSYTNNGVVTALSALTGNGSWTQGSGTLNVGCTSGNFDVTTFAASGAGNTVNYTRAANQTVRNPTGAIYHHLGLAGSGTKTLTANTDCNGNVTISSTFDVTNNDYNLTVAGNWSSTGTFTEQNGTVTFDGAAAQSISVSGGETFYNVIFAAAGTKTLLSNISSTTNVTFNAGTGTLSAGAFNISIVGNWVNNGGTFLPGTGTVDFTGAAAETIFKATTESFNNITFSGGGTKTLLVAIAATGDITINAGSGAFIANNLNISLGGSWINNGGTFTPGTNTVTFNSTTSETIFKGGGETFRNLVFSGAGTKTLLSAITATGNLTINAGAGALTANTFGITVTGNWTNSGGTFSGGTGTVTFNGAVAQTISKAGSTETFASLVFTLAGTKTLLSDISATGNLTINIGSGALIANTFAITVGGNWADNSTFTCGTGTVTFNGTAAQTISKPAGEIFNNVTFSGAGTKTLLSTITVNNDLTINAGSGALIANTFNITITGDWINNGGTFTPGNTTQTFNGAAAQTIFKSGSAETFGVLLFTTAGTKTLLSDISCSGNLTI